MSQKPKQDTKQVTKCNEQLLAQLLHEINLSLMKL